MEILNNNSKYVKLLFLYISSSETTIEFIFYILDSFHKYEHFESDRWKDFNSRGWGAQHRTHEILLNVLRVGARLHFKLTNINSFYNKNEMKMKWKYEGKLVKQLHLTCIHMMVWGYKNVHLYNCNLYGKCVLYFSSVSWEVYHMFYWLNCTNNTDTL